MTRKEKRLLRLAVAIDQQLTVKQAANTGIELPVTLWRQCEAVTRRMRRAQRRGWNFAAQRVQRDLQNLLRELRGELSKIERTYESSRNESHRASAADIHADLVGLYEEFDQVSFNRRDQTISVTTEPIEFDGIYLGPFEVRLNWSKLNGSDRRRYRVIAVDPNPAASNDGVTHPHVQDEAVCEGEGQQPIEQALAQGRLLDFFVIVASLLRTYNADSPFVSISEWHGEECSDCATVVAGDERWVCERCDTVLCGGCYLNCPGCDYIVCNDCLTPCEGCEENHCLSCTKTCSCCHIELCPSCLNNKERCSDCHDKETSKTDEEPVSSEQPAGQCNTVAPFHADCVG